MKGWSIEKKVTLWYAGFMMILITMIVIGLLIISNNQALLDMQKELRKVVSNTFDEIYFDGQQLKFGETFKALENQVYLSIYDKDGNLIVEAVPAKFKDEEIYFVDNKIQIQKEGSTKWFTYMSSRTIEGYGKVWVRGMVSQTEAEVRLYNLIRVMLLILPIFIVLAIGGGYIITKRAFRPVRQIRKMAEAISKGKDLSQRIRLGEGRDEIHQLAETFDSMLERLEKVFENEKRFTSDASHELRTPTSVIMSRCEYTLKNATTIEEAKESLEVILGQSKKMSRLISQLLMLSRSDHNNIVLQLEVINLSELVEIVAEEQAEFAAEKGITICNKVEPDIMMRADQTMMMRLFINLFNNAITYGRPNGNIVLELKKEQESIAGSIIDDGIGIQIEEQEKIWERFYQVNQERTVSEIKGAGLGLSMVKWIVEAHGGTIKVESEMEKGTTFKFEFPIKNENN